MPILLALTKSIPRTAIALALVMVPSLLVLEKWQAQMAIQRMRGWVATTRKAVILGTGTLGRSIFSTLVRSPKFGLDPVAFIETDSNIMEPVIYEASYQRKRQARVLPGPVTAQPAAPSQSDGADHRGTGDFSGCNGRDYVRGRGGGREQLRHS